MDELLTASERAEVLNLINSTLEANDINLVVCAYEDRGCFFEITLVKEYENKPIKEIKR